jgi:hypothetical protein
MLSFCAAAASVCRDQHQTRCWATACGTVWQQQQQQDRERRQ